MFDIQLFHMCKMVTVEKAYNVTAENSSGSI